MGLPERGSEIQRKKMTIEEIADLAGNVSAIANKCLADVCQKVDIIAGTAPMPANEKKPGETCSDSVHNRLNTSLRQIEHVLEAITIEMDRL